MLVTPKIRSMERRQRLGVTVLGVLGLVAGCATPPPVQELSNARQAIMAAEDAGAGEFAADRFIAAQNLLDRAEEKLHERDYRGARVDAVSAHSRAIEARVMARANLSERVN